MSEKGEKRKETVITTENFSFQYNTKKDDPVKTLNNINLNISKGDFILLCGPTGSGKTTFIRALNGLIPHFYHGDFYGYVKILGQDSVEIGPAQISKNVGTMFQNPENQLFSLNVERELVFALQNLGFSCEEISERIENALTITNTHYLRDRPPYDLSGGEQQKVAIASLLSLDPDILVLDEPLSNLDPISANEIVELLKNLNQKQQKTIIISEHRLEYVLPYITKIMIVKEGQMIKFDSANTIINQELIYDLGLDLPPLTIWFKNHQNIQNLSESIPLQPEERQKYLHRLLGEKYLNNQQNKSEPQGNTQTELASDLDTEDPIILADHIHFTYQAEKDPVYALKNISFEIKKQDIIGIIGPNGAGKSTLVRCIMGLNSPSQGDIWINGNNISLQPVYKTAEQVGLVFQNPDHQLFANTVNDEMLFSLKSLHLSKEEQESRIVEILKKLDLMDLRDSSPFNVSGGQKKKVALASIVCRKPNILIFDEPTIGQDGKQKAHLIN